ncbi:MAG: N-formylglutamate amidohydrolase [Planctomycetaceae bacterium]|nr:N-formylglutamate amidohydrolase [Planctomycetaceae bacterium]
MTSLAARVQFAIFSRLVARAALVVMIAPSFVGAQQATPESPAAPTRAAKAAPSDPLIDVRRGTIPIIICAPHGGGDKIPEVSQRKQKPVDPPRGTPKWVTGADVRTRELAQKIVADLETRLGGKPYFVMARFHRRYIDANRAPEHSYEDDDAKFYYDAYHDAAAEFCAEVQKKFGAGLVFDVHGQASFKDEILIGTVGGVTVKLLLERHGRGALVGREGLVGRMLDAGLKVKPALDSETLNVAAGLNGGYTVQTYGSHRPTALDAIQLEYGTDLRSPEKLDDTARRSAEAIAGFYQAYFQRRKAAAAE